MTAYCHDERHDTPCPLPCPACEAECQVELIDGDVRVAWSELGEGYNGFYDPEDPEDRELLRFDIYRRDGIDWEPVDDASYCTAVPVDTPVERQAELLRVIMDEVRDSVLAGESVKKRCEALSWLSA